MINWEVILWTCITIAVLLGIFGMILSIISAVNMRKKRKSIGELHTNLGVGSRIMFAGGLYGKVVEVKGEELLRVEIAPKTIIEISRYAVIAIEK